MKRLHLILQLGSEVQIIYEIFHLHTLKTDHLRPFSRLVRKFCVILHLRGISHDHGKRRSDVMRHAGDPVRTGTLFLLKFLFLYFQFFGRFINRMRQIRKQSFLPDIDPFLGKRFDPADQRADISDDPRSGKCVDQKHYQQIHKKDHHCISRQIFDQRQIIRIPHRFPIRLFRMSHDQQIIFSRRGCRRIILDIPQRIRGNLRSRIMKRDLRRQVLTAPYNIAGPVLNKNRPRIPLC